MINGENKPSAEHLWTTARNSLNRFLDSTEVQDIHWRIAKQRQLDYIEARMKEIKSWINGEVKPEDIGPLADARNIFWDLPMTALQEEYCQAVFELSSLLRKQGIGMQKVPTRPVER